MVLPNTARNKTKLSISSLLIFYNAHNVQLTQTAYGNITHNLQTTGTKKLYSFSSSDYNRTT